MKKLFKDPPGKFFSLISLIVICGLFVIFFLEFAADTVVECRACFRGYLGDDGDFAVYSPCTPFG